MIIIHISLLVFLVAAVLVYKILWEITCKRWRKTLAEKARLAEIVFQLLPAYKRHCDFTKACEIENELTAKDRRGND